MKEKMKNSLKIRKARMGDLPRIVKIFVKEYSVSPYNEKWSNERALKKLRGYFDNSDVFVLLINNEIKGFAIAARIIWDWGNLVFGEEIAISKSEQGKGHGRAMISFLEKYYKNKGFKKFQFAANRKSPAYKLYKRLGYKNNNMEYLEKKL